MLFWLGDILGKIYEFYEMDPSTDNEGSGMVKSISLEEYENIMNLDNSPTLEAACEVLVMENYLENIPQGGVSYTLLCLLFYTLSWLGRAEKAVCKGEQNYFSGLREHQPSFLPSPSALPMPMVLGLGSMSGADALGYLSTLDALAAPEHQGYWSSWVYPMAPSSRYLRERRTEPNMINGKDFLCKSQLVSD